MAIRTLDDMSVEAQNLYKELHSQKSMSDAQIQSTLSEILEYLGWLEGGDMQG